MDNNQQIGNINIVSGVPERVGMPVQVFKEVGAVLTERYWQNKQMYDSITTSLKNMPTLDDKFDKELLSQKSKMVDEKFKEVIDTDNFHNATSTVMDVSKTLSTDEGIKALNYNVQQYNEQYKKMEEGFKDNPMWRTHIDTFKAMTKSQYKGSVDENGKAVVARIFTPKTDMDISKERDDIAKAMKDLETIKTTSFGNTQYVDSQILESIDNPILRKAHAKLSEDKITRETITVERLRKAAMDVLNSDNDYKLKQQEILQVEHFKNTGRLNVSKDDLSKVLDNIAPTQLNELYLNLSPTYSKNFKDLQIAYTLAVDNNDLKSANKIGEQFKNLNSKKDLFIKEGKDIYTNSIKPEEIESIYYGLQSNNMTDSLLKTAERFKVDKVDYDRHYTDTGLSTTLREIMNQQQESRVYGQATETNLLNNVEAIYDENSDLQRDLKLKEQALITIQNTKGADPLEIQKAQLAYDRANAQIKATSEALLNTFRSFSPDEKEKVIRDSWSLFDDKSRLAFTKTKSIAFRKSESEKISIDTILKKIEPLDLLKLNNKQILEKYGTPELKSYLSKYSGFTSNYTTVLNDVRKRLVSATKKHMDESGRSLMVADYEIRGSGKSTSQTQRLNDAIISSFLSYNEDGVNGRLIDLETGQPLQGLEQYGFSNIKNPTLDDINNNGEIQVNRIVSPRYSGKDAYSVKVPVKIKDSEGNFTGQTYTKEFKVAYQGNPQMSVEADVSDINNLKQAIKSNSYDALQTSYMLARRLGSTLQVANGKNLQDIANNLKQINITDKSKYYKHKIDMVQGRQLNDGQLRSELIITVEKGKAKLEYWDGKTLEVINDDIKDFDNIVTYGGMMKALRNGMDAEMYKIMYQGLKNN